MLKRHIKVLGGAIAALAAIAAITTQTIGEIPNADQKASKELGAFSLSLSVKDLQASKDFYEKLGFEKFGGDESHNYLIMKNGTTLIGLFQGMIDTNMLTFNPGWDHNAKETDPFTDVRDLQKQLRAKGIEFTQEADEATEGPAFFFIADPDGNVILVDQHR